MDFDNLMHYDFITGLYRFIPFRSIFLFWYWPYSLHCIVQCVKFEIHSVGTVSEVSHESNVKIVTLVITKNVMKSEIFLKKNIAGQVKENNLKDFQWQNKKWNKKDYERIGKTI